MGIDAVRFPLATDLKTSISDTSKDARMYNGLAEVRSGETRVKKRPGMVQTGYNYASPSGAGFGFGGLPLLIYNDTLLIGDGLFVPTSWDRSRWYDAGEWVWFGGLEWFSLYGSLGEAPGWGLGGWIQASPYSSGDSYSTNDAVVSPGDEGNNESGQDVVWYAVQPSTGVTPGNTAAAHPYWSRYPTKPIGTHPGYSYQDSSITVPPNPGPYDAFTTTHTEIVTCGAYSATYLGTSVRTPGPWNIGDVQTTYYYASGLTIIQGIIYYPNSTTPGPTLLSPYYAVLDYQRSHLV